MFKVKSSHFIGANLLKSNLTRRFFSIKFNDKNDEITYSQYNQGINIKHWTCLPADRSIPFDEIKEIVIPEFFSRSGWHLLTLSKYYRDIYQLRTKSNEIYSLSSRTCLELPQYSKWYKIFSEHNIPIYDQGKNCIWRAVNEPFNYGSKVSIEENIELLHQHYKIPKQELKDLYEKISNPLKEYLEQNIEKFCTAIYCDVHIHKEWIELGFSDILLAMSSQVEFNQFAVQFTLKYEDRSKWRIVNGVVVN